MKQTWNFPQGRIIQFLKIPPCIWSARVTFSVTWDISYHHSVSSKLTYQYKSSKSELKCWFINNSAAELRVCWPGCCVLDWPGYIRIVFGSQRAGCCCCCWPALTIRLTPSCCCWAGVQPQSVSDIPPVRLRQYDTPPQVGTISLHYKHCQFGRFF